MSHDSGHLTGKSGYTHELLAALTDDELDEQIAHYRERRRWYRSNADEVKPVSPYKPHAYAAYRYGIWIDMAEAEQAKRHLTALN